MNPLTHALASYSLKRAAFPRAPRAVTLAMLIAGTIADVDFLSGYFGPASYFTFYRTYCHSIPAALVITLLASLPFFFLKPKTSENPVSRSITLVAALSA